MLLLPIWNRPVIPCVIVCERFTEAVEEGGNCDGFTEAVEEGGNSNCDGFTEAVEEKGTCDGFTETVEEGGNCDRLEICKIAEYCRF